jgi:hypothetical protein
LSVFQSQGLVFVQRTVGGTPKSTMLVFVPIITRARRDVLGHRLLAASTADAATVDNVALLGLVTQTTGLIGARGAAGAVDDVQLAELLMHSQQCSTSNINWESSSRGCRFIPPSTAKKVSKVLGSS